MNREGEGGRGGGGTGGGVQLLFSFLEPSEDPGPRNATLEAALAYARRGWPVFPAHGIDSGRCTCGRDRCRTGKHPVPPDGMRSATTVVERILAWGDLWSRSNLAIHTGGEAGLVVLDVDGDQGADALRRLETAQAPLPPTPTVRTGGGGRHIYFAHPGGRIPCSAGRLGPGLDVRADGGYVIAPPSTHASGASYEWAPGNRPEDMELAPIPSWLLPLLASKDRSKPDPRGHDEVDPRPPHPIVLQGERNTTLASIAGTMRLRGLDALEIEPALQAFNTRCCRPPLDPDEVAAVVRSVARYPSRRSTASSQDPRDIRTNQLAAAAPPAARPVVVPLSAIQPASLAWLWSGRIPLGKLTLLAGDPGLGKSLVALDIAARITTARDWPDAAIAAPERSSVLLLSAEDDPGDTLHPRLLAAGADPERVRILLAIADSSRERPFDLSQDLEHLSVALDGSPDTRLVILDPLSAYLGGVDSHVDAAVRALLSPLATLAFKHRVAILAITHLRKAGGKAIYRTMGSLAFAAAARSVYLVEKDPREPRRRLLLPIKGNLSPLTTGLAYSIEATDRGPVVAWEPDPVHADPDQLECQPEPGTDALQVATDFLLKALANGPCTVADLQSEASRSSIAPATLRRARALLGLRPRKDGYRGCWVLDPPAA